MDHKAKLREMAAPLWLGSLVCQLPSYGAPSRMAGLRAWLTSSLRRRNKNGERNPQCMNVDGGKANHSHVGTSSLDAANQISWYSTRLDPAGGGDVATWE